MARIRMSVAFGLAALLAACSSDSTSNPDGPGSSTDAGPPTNITADMKQANETGTGEPCTAAASGATGTLTGTISGDGNTITVSITYSGLSSAAQMAHIHFGAPGVAGPVVVGFTNVGTSPITATIKSTDSITFPSGVANFADFVAKMKAGMTYANIHTANCGSGEIRGNITTH